MFHLFLVFFSFYLDTNQIATEDSYIVRDQIFIGDWCIFSEEVYKYVLLERDDDGQNVQFLFGMVLGFTYLDGKTFKQREYSKTFASVTCDAQSQRGVGVLCSFYTCDFDGFLTALGEVNHKFINIKYYVGTIKAPDVSDRMVTISTKIIEKLVTSPVSEEK